MFGQFNANEEGSGMNMATHGAIPTEKTSIPSPTKRAWTAFLKDNPAVQVRIEAQQHWIDACEEAAPKLGVLVEAVDATPAVDA